MATREKITDMLEFCKRTLWPSKKIDEDLIKLFYNSFRGFTDKEVRDAAYKFLAQAHEKTPFPKPGDISSRIIKSEEKSKFRIEPGHYCRSCFKHDCTCIIEPPEFPSWTCRQCYTGYSDSEIASKFKGLENMLWDKQKKGGKG